MVAVRPMSVADLAEFENKNGNINIPNKLIRLRHLPHVNIILLNSDNDSVLSFATAIFILASFKMRSARIAPTA